MKKITLLLLCFSTFSWAQYSCETAVSITDGYTSGRITTAGTGSAPGSWITGVESCGDANTGSFTSKGDDYLFSYTTGDLEGESVTFKITAHKRHASLAAFTICNGTALTGCKGWKYALLAGDYLTVSAANLPANQTVYFAIGRNGGSSNNDLDFTVTNFTVTPAPTANVEDFSINKIVAYPNPVTDVLNLSYPEIIDNVTVYNILGQQVINKNFNTNEVKIDVAMLPAGNYIVKANTLSGTKTTKIVKQ